MKLYTRRGDGGETGLFGGGRVPKDDPRVEAYGTVDELGAALGVADAHLADAQIQETLTTIQGDLFAIGAHLATPPPRAGRPHPTLPILPLARIAQMESWIDAAERETPPLRRFILPAGTAGACHLHHARALCRRAERRCVTLAARVELDPGIIRYLNRLSDYLFAAARLANHRDGRADTEWEGGP